LEIYLPLLVVLLLLSGFFSSAETAFLSIQRLQLEHAVRGGDAGARRVAALLTTPSRLLSAILLGNNLVNTAAAAVGTVIATELVTGGGGVIVATAAMTVLLVIFGEVGPKTIALQYSYPLSAAYALPIRPWIIVTRPIVAMLDLVSRAAIRVVGARHGDGDALSLGELRTAIHVGRELGVLRATQSAMLLGALALHNIPLRRVMVPRVEVATASEDEPIATVAERMVAAGYRRIPVIGESIDDVRGFVHIQEVTRSLLRGEGDRPVGTVIRPITFEPEVAPAAAVLERMQASGEEIVMVIDEHGSTVGLVTAEDLLDEVVGEARSEALGTPLAAPAGGVRRHIVVPGRQRLSDLNAQLGSDLSHPAAETVAGLILEHLHRIPARGEVIDIDGYRFTIVAADQRRIARVEVEALPPGTPARD
jgi:CBS domain containing-hemolysin-like protein